MKYSAWFRRHSIAALVVLMPMLMCAALRLLIAHELQEQAYTQALERWAGRPFSHYRVVMQEENCYTDFEVENERVVWSYEASCGRGRARTIASLFALIEREQPPAALCTSQRCICERITTVSAEYDQQLGFPRIVRISTRLLPNWRSADYWREVVRLQREPCQSENKREISVLSVQPL